MSEGKRMGVLHGEHVLLGATFSPSAHTGILGVSTYPNPVDPASDGAFLADLTGCAYLLASGQDTASFCGAALAGRRLGVGESAFEAALTGDGRLLAAPLVIRTGDTEFVIVDATRPSDCLAPWLEFVAGAREGGVSAFPSVRLEEASAMLVPLLLFGRSATAVLLDYVRDGERLPEPGSVAQLRLDAIPSVVASLEMPLVNSAYLVLVPPAFARVLWRSLLSFTEVAPVGLETLRSMLDAALPWAALLDGSGPVEVSRELLASWGIVRDDTDFVGGRQLA